MKNIKLLLIIIASMAARSAQAHNAASYEHTLPTPVMSSILLNDNAKSLQSGLRPFRVASKLEVSTATLTQQTYDVMILGRAAQDGVSFDIELHAQLEKGVLSTIKSMDQLRILLSDWAAQYGKPADFRKSPVQVKNVVYHDETGFQSKHEVQARLHYEVLMTVPVQPGTLRVPDQREELKKAAQFIQWVDRDHRGRVVMDNNQSNRPAFIFVNKEGLVEGRHPFHAIVFNTKTKKAAYEYAAPLPAVSTLWEIKRLLKRPEIKSLIGSDTSTIQTRMKFQDKKNYSGQWINRATNSSVLFSVINGRFQQDAAQPQ